MKKRNAEHNNYKFHNINNASLTSILKKPR